MGNLSAKQTDIRIATKITSAHGNVTPEAKLSLAIQATYTSATSTYQISETITGGADTIDLVGSLVDDLGDAVTFQKVHCLFYHSTSASSSLMTITNNFAAGSEGPDDVRLKGGAYNTFIDESGLAITGGADIITITGTTGDPYDIVVIGRKPA